MLTVSAIDNGYRNQQAIYDVSLKVDRGEIVTLIGHNGAGKTTTLKSIIGLLPVWRGEVEFDGERITGSAVAANVRRGLCMVLEDDFVFRDLSVADNLELAAFLTPEKRRPALVEQVFAMLPVLDERRRQRAGTMSGGERRMLSIGMAVMSDARMLLLDEPSLGLSPILVERVMTIVQDLVRERGMSVLMVEQSVRHALEVADRAYVLRAGRVELEDDADRLLQRSQLWDLF